MEKRRNPDSDFVLFGRKSPLIIREPVLSNSAKTTTSKNLSQIMNLSNSMDSTTIDDLERSLNQLKFDLKQLNASLTEDYDRSAVYARDSNYIDDYHVNKYRQLDLDSRGEEHDDSEEDVELTKILQRTDEEAVSHIPPQDSQWFRDPKHKTESLGNYPALQSLGIPKRKVSPRNRPPGHLGSEIATKNIYGDVNHLDLSANDTTFPVRLTAPHIVGVRSLLPPKFPVRKQNPDRSASPVRQSRSRSRTYNPIQSPKRPAWRPSSWRPNASANSPPKFNNNANKARALSLSRPSTAIGIRRDYAYEPTNYTLNSDGTTIRRQVRALPTETELSFLRSTDEIDTRRALVDNSPYQQELAKLRLQRLRVEEEYLLQLKRDSELERIRGPKKHWYEMTGPQFHYECNKNTALHQNKKQWSSTLKYRDDLLDASREFAEGLN